MKRVIPLFISFFLIATNLAPATRVHGADCSDASKIFQSSYNVSFAFEGNGLAQVTQKVSLKNLVDGCFASEYSLGINSANITNVSGSDSLGKLSTNVTKKETTSTITAKLNDEVIGKNKAVTFELKYTVDGLATNRGLTWEILVPTVETKEKVNDYNLTVSVPKSYGEVFSVQPNPEKISPNDKSTTLVFSKNTALGSTVFANFGSKQQISFKLGVSLHDSQFLTKSQVFPIPPDTNRQNVLYTKLTPAPTEFERDTLGNLIGEFISGGSQKTQAEIEGVVTLVGGDTLLPDSEDLGDDELDIFLDGGKYVQVNNTLVQEKANELETVEKIYEFVIDLLEFNTKSYERGKDDRKTASEMLRGATLTTNQGFTDLFASLTKAAGVPTKLVYGLVVNDQKSFRPVFVGAPLNTKNLSIWAQVYDKKTDSWINVDPTFGDALGIDYVQDNFLDRIVLFHSVNGDDIDLLEGVSVTKENIEVDYVTKELNKKSEIDLVITYDQIFAGFPVDVNVTLENKNGLTIHNPELKIETLGVELVGKDSLSLEQIFPFERREVNLKLRAGNLFDQQEGSVEVTLAGESGFEKINKSEKEEVQIKAFFTLGAQQLLLFFVLILLAAGFIFPKIRKSKLK